MIVRILTATVPIANSGSVHLLLRDQVSLLKDYDGLRYLKLARRTYPDHEEIILVEEWRDLVSMMAWTGPDIARPRLLDRARPLVDTVSVTHYEALDIDPETDIPTLFGDHPEFRPDP